MPTASGNLNTTSSIVTSVNERTSNGTGALGVTSTVSGVSERTVNASGTPATGVSSVTGVSAREIRSGVALQSTTNNLVVGAGDRGSNASGITAQNNPSVVAGITEREINVTGIEQVSASTVAGVAEREVKQNTGAVQAGPSSTVNGTSVIIGRNAKPNWITTPSLVFGQAKVEFTARGLESQPITNNLVTGLAERVIDDQGGITITLEDNLVTGVAERQINLLQGIFSGESDSEQSTLGGVGVQKQTFVGSGAFQPIDFNLVTGVAEREIEDNLVTAALQPITNNLLSGVAERTVVGTGTMADSDNIVAGIAELEGVGSGVLTTGTSTVTASVFIKRVTSGTFKPTDNNLVTGLGEREIDINIQTQFLMSGDASVVGLSEREVVGSGTPQTSTSSVVGLSENVITGSGTLETGVSSVTGLSERTVVSISADLIHPDSKTRPPLNQAERIMVISGINGFILSGQSSITATANVGRLTSGAFRPTEEHLVAGVAERVITVDSGIDTPDDVSEANGSGVRVSNGSGIEQVGPSTVSGIAERQIDLESGITQVEDSIVAGVAERTVVEVDATPKASSSVTVSLAERIITSDSAALQDNSNIVNGVGEVINTADFAALQPTANNLVDGSGVRTVHTEPTSILGDTANAPTDADNQVEYVAAFGSRNHYYPRLTNLGVNNYEGIYNVSGLGYVVQESGSNYARIPSTAYNAYFKFRGNNNIDIIVFNITRNAWYVSTASVTEFLTNSLTVAGGALNQEILTSSSISKPYGSEFDPVAAPDNLVNGVAERIIVSEETTLDTTPSLVNGFAERKSVANGLIVTDITIQVVANIGRITNPELQPGSSRIVGSAEDIHVDDDATPATGPSTVSGVAERIVVSELAIDMTDDVSYVDGLAERTINDVDATPKAQASVVDGLSERTVVLESGIEQAQESVVAGVAERQIDLDAGIAQVDASVVAGIAERTINAAGVIVDNSNVVNGVSEREIRTSAALRPTTDNLVTGIAERTINLFQSPKAQPSQVTGLSERQIDYITGAAGTFPGPGSSSILGLAERVVTLDSGLFSADSDLEQSHIIGLGERTINLVQGLIQDSDLEQSHVTGLSERIVNLLNGIDMPDDASDVVGVAERIVVLDSGILMPDDLSDVAGVAERKIVGEQGFIQDSDLEQSHVVGLSERIINQLDGGDFKPITNNLVTGIAEREIEINEVTQALKPTENNLVNGLAERIIVLEEGIFSNSSDSEQSHVVALLDSAPVLTIVRKPIEDAVEASSSEVDTVDADRVVRQLTTGDNVLTAAAPSSSDARVSYSGKFLVLSGVADPVYDGTYDLLGQGYTVATSGFTDYVLTSNDNSLVYSRYISPGVYYVVAYNTGGNNWTVFETSVNPQDAVNGFYDTRVLAGSVTGAETVATSSDIRNRPYRSFRPTENNLVTGVAEREIEINEITQNLQSGPSTIVGSGFRTSVNLQSDVQAQPSTTIVGLLGSFAERIIDTSIFGVSDFDVNADPSTVSGVAERIIEQNEQNANLKGSSSTTGVAERIIGWQRGDLVVPTRSRVVGVAEREIETNNITQDLYATPSLVTGVAERTINLFQGIFSNSSDSEQSHTDNALFPSQGFRTSNLIEGINSNDSDEQASVIAGTIDGTGERVVVNAPNVQPKSQSSGATGIAERKIDTSIFGVSDFDVQAQPSTVTGVAERTVNLFDGVGIPSIVGSREILQGNSFDWSLREGYNRDSSLGFNNGVDPVTGLAPNDGRDYAGIFSLPFVDKDFLGRTKNVYEIRSPIMTINGEPDDIGGGFDTSKPSRLINRFVRLDSHQPWTGEFETYYQPDDYLGGWDSTAKKGIVALFNHFDSSGDIKGTPARWNRTPQNWVVYKEYRDDTRPSGRTRFGYYTPFKVTAAGSRYHQDHDLAWSDSGGYDLDNGYRYPRQLFYYPYYNGEQQASFYREGPHPGKWSYVFWGADQWFVFINEDIHPSQLVEGYTFDYSNIDPLVNIGRYYNWLPQYDAPLDVQEAFDSTMHRGYAHFPFETMTSASITSGPTQYLWEDPKGQYAFTGFPNTRTGPDLQDSDAQIELTWTVYNDANQFEGYTPWITGVGGPGLPSFPSEDGLVGDDPLKIGVWTLDSPGQDPATLPVWNTLRQSRLEDYSGDIGTTDTREHVRGSGWIVAPLARIYDDAVDYDSNPEYAQIYHTTDPSEVDGVAERKVVSVSAALVVDNPSVVNGIAEREIDINEINQNIKPIEHNIVTGVAERIITVDAGVRSADDFTEEQSRIEAIVYTNNIEQSRIHTKRKFVLRKERTKTFIVRQTPTG